MKIPAPMTEPMTIIVMSNVFSLLRSPGLETLELSDIWNQITLPIGSRNRMSVPPCNYIDSKSYSTSGFETTRGEPRVLSTAADVVPPSLSGSPSPETPITVQDRSLRHRSNQDFRTKAEYPHAPVGQSDIFSRNLVVSLSRRQLTEENQLDWLRPPIGVRK